MQYGSNQEMILMIHAITPEVRSEISQEEKTVQNNSSPARTQTPNANQTIRATW